MAAELSKMGAVIRERPDGLEIEEISPAEMNEKFPWARTDDLQAGFHVPAAGHDAQAVPRAGGRHGTGNGLRDHAAAGGHLHH